jgi:DNA-binding transcriptional MocR family regulator
MHCFANGQGEHSFRLAFSFAPKEKLDEAITRIGAAIRAVA